MAAHEDASDEATNSHVQIASPLLYEEATAKLKCLKLEWDEFGDLSTWIFGDESKEKLSVGLQYATNNRHTSDKRMRTKAGSTECRGWFVALCRRRGEFGSHHMSGTALESMVFCRSSKLRGVLWSKKQWDDHDGERWIEFCGNHDMSGQQRTSMVACYQCTEIEVDQETLQFAEPEKSVGKSAGKLEPAQIEQGNSVKSVNSVKQDQTGGSASSESCDQNPLPCNRRKSGKTLRYRNSKVAGTEYIQRKGGPA
ncbi:hypothetical protein LY76DRAFT_609126 [Colletotrichum caudatum]|nr:hypothetical protein LY76DRAFT_609126 [Colletotrichum caudatum]